ncbi:MAG: AbrB/MazE/SpoVT family DNA-binding domain-containing protein [Bryobacteraceae bacterium]|nr:AbrB/MazE/SpoVT family DNA-binding domain-containing protein [Bryobacteraceae bacterium]
MLKAKITTIGNSVGVILPKELVAKLKLEKGDTVTLTETERGVELSPFDEDFEQAMEIAREGMRRYRNTLRELAK